MVDSQPPGGAGHLTGILPQIWPCSAALKNEKLNPAIPRPQWAEDTNDLCLIIGI